MWKCDKVVIVGCQKCGTTSLLKWLQQYFPNENLFRNETWFHRKDGVKEYLKYCSDYRPVIILRDPVERAWSEYNYQIKRKIYTHSYPDAIEKLGYDEVVGETNPIAQSCYLRWIETWMEFRPIILHLEQMQKILDFPKKNQNEYDPMPENLRILTKKLLTDKT